MNKSSLRIVYMGTPEFAVPTLRRLLEESFHVVGVVTMPDKPVGRHQSESTPSPVKQFALSRNIPVLQPEKLKNPTFLEELRSLKADLQIVVAFRMLPEEVWAMPHLGTFNLHAALLPQYRGAAPINRAIINGEKQTGVTTFFLDKDMDTGKIIKRKATPILDTENAGDVHDKLMMLGADLVVETVEDILSGHVHPIPQEELQTSEPLHLAPKIFKETCRIDWTRGVKQTYDFVRGLAPRPGAWTVLSHGGKELTLKIFAAEKELSPTLLTKRDGRSETFSALPGREERKSFIAESPAKVLGTLLSDGKTYLKVILKDGCLSLKILQPAGKKRMEVADFLRGFRLDGTEQVV